MLAVVCMAWTIVLLHFERGAWRLWHAPLSTCLQHQDGIKQLQLRHGHNALMITYADMVVGQCSCGT